MMIPIVILCLPARLLAQVRSVVIKGSVIDRETNESLIGVTISLSGKKLQGLGATDSKGNFKVSVPEGSTLVFKYIGYAELKVTINPGKTELTVAMTQNASIMQDVVIRGYQARSREETTGSSFIVTGKEIQDIPVSNAEALLQGRVPGLNVQVNTGAPGYRGTVAIRGVSSIDVSGSGDQSYLTPTSPLYVIDGIPVEADATADYGYNSPGPGVSPLSLIPVEDIASIEVLKDVQATSLYGSRGAYGVILITTKRGNSAKPRLRYTSNYFVNTPPKLRTTLGGKAERDAKIQEIQAMGSYADYLRISGTPILADSLNAFYRNSTDWQGIYYGTTYNTTQNVSIDGGDNKFNYKANIGYYSESGIIQNTGFDRYSINMNVDYRPDDKLHIFFGVSGGLGKKNKGNGQGLFQTGVATNAAASSLLPGPSLFQETSGVLADLTVKDYNNSKNIRPNLQLGYQLFKGLNLSATASYDYSVNTEETYTPAAANNNYSGVYAYNDRGSNLYGRGGFSYTHSFGKGKHNINLNTFGEIYVKGFQAGYIRQKNTPNDQLQGPLGANSGSFGGGVLKSFHDEHTVSYASAFSYDFKKKYIIDLTYRLDASSLSGFDNPFAKNYSVATKWNFNKEHFFEKLKWLTFGDIRLSTGRNVKPSGNVYSLYGTYFPNGNYMGSSRVAIDYTTIPNSVLRPTTTTDVNLGLDLGFFDSKLELIFDTYYKRVTNLQRSISLATTTGFSSVLSNDAGVLDYGYELAVTARPLSNKSKVFWSITANGAINKDFLIQLPGNKNLIIVGGSTVLQVGRNTLSNYLLKTKGVYSTDQQVPVDPVTGLKLRSSTNSTAFFKAGDPIWQDVNGDYVIDNNDKQVTGNSQPVVTGGLSSVLTYKSFSINVNASYTFKRDIINGALSSRLTLVNNPFNTSAILPLSDLNYWKRPGDQAVYPNPFDYSRSAAINPFRADQTLFQESGSYFKINSVTLAYSFDKKFISRLGLSGLRLYFSANNIITFSPYSGPNPENVTALGYDASGGYPVSRTYNVGLNLDL
ncbi:SusC/RagA family TonB-linked outer membrane protein [Mucilaginibacter sp. PPCGB 2223]|uniref:SusC/RagA family TonB-linked outer membrane protein n=1 Tax=Mucilaginibacter sp. PPCGB 2223 TaxID=1886027 RepID=UPI00082503FC|nr:SusC/RagA family TonB-linked outer membrane protein [Mucilaginibacter sp. PPCGB 2223]OCX52724.1 SusC/RagA family TonB-linked outer membrane protein [Mucilaginibacter sp. PPCGB 2223]